MEALMYEKYSILVHHIVFSDNKNVLHRNVQVLFFTQNKMSDERLSL
jgi:hypothetical protein